MKGGGEAGIQISKWRNMKCVGYGWKFEETSEKDDEIY